MCLFNMAVIAVLQFAITTGRGAPVALFLLFEGIWLFGAVMLLVAPRFGATGTAAWGILAAVAAYRTHRSLDASNTTILVASILGAVVAIAFLVQRLRK